MAKASIIYDNKAATTALMFLLGAVIPLIGFIFIIVGIVLTWMNKTWPMWAKVVITVVATLWFTIMIMFFGVLALIAGTASKSTNVSPTTYMQQVMSPTPSTDY